MPERDNNSRIDQLRIKSINRGTAAGHSEQEKPKSPLTTFLPTGVTEKDMQAIEEYQKQKPKPPREPEHVLR